MMSAPTVASSSSSCDNTLQRSQQSATSHPNPSEVGQAHLAYVPYMPWNPQTSLEHTSGRLPALLPLLCPAAMWPRALRDGTPAARSSTEALWRCLAGVDLPIAQAQERHITPSTYLLKLFRPVVTYVIYSVNCMEVDIFFKYHLSAMVELTDRASHLDQGLLAKFPAWAGHFPN